MRNMKFHLFFINLRSVLAINTVGYVAAPTLVGSLEPMATVIIWPNLENAHRNYLTWVIFFVFEGGSVAFRMGFMRTSVCSFFSSYG